MANESVVSLPPNVEDPLVLRRVLARIIESLDVAVGARSAATLKEYVSKKELTTLSKAIDFDIAALKRELSQQVKLTPDQQLLKNAIFAISLNKDNIQVNKDGIASINAAAVAAGYGGIKQATPQAIADIAAATYQDVTTWDTDVIASPVDVTQSFATNSISIDGKGVWAISMSIELEFVSTNGDRKISLQLYNASEVAELGHFGFYLGRNQAGADLSITLKMFDLPLTSIGDALTLRIGNGDAFTGVTINAANLEVHRISSLDSTI